jgi:two-component system, NtrC family, sensor kinase
LKLVRKLILALVVVIVAVMTVDAVLQFRREVALFEDDMAQDERALGQVLRVAVEGMADEVGIERAARLFTAAAQSERRVNLRWVWLDDPAVSSALAPDARGQLAAGDTVRVVRDEGPEGARQFNYVPLHLPGSRAAAIELSEPLAPQRAFIRHTELEVLATLLVMILLAALVAGVLGVGLVGRPLRALAEQARRIGAGDLSRRLDLAQRDEIGGLALELNATCDRLVEAQARVGEETEKRIAALEQLRHADRLKTVGQLASGVAHELGTPLNVVSGRAKLIVAGGLGDGDVVASARVIAEQADRMTAIIRQLLDFARRRGSRAVVADLRDIVRRTVDMLGVMARGRRVVIDLQLPASPFPIRTNPNQLEQAIANVLVNGIQAMPDGGPMRVRLGARTAPGDRGEPRAYFTVTVEDEGGGIAADHIGRIFEPFFTTKGIGEGTGLGLAVAHGIVAEHGGWIEVQSEVGSGTRFELVLEAEAAAPQNAEAV